MEEKLRSARLEAEKFKAIMEAVDRERSEAVAREREIVAREREAESVCRRSWAMGLCG